MRPDINRGPTTALISAILAAAALGGCSSGATSSPAVLRVVTSTTVLADLVEQVSGDRVEVQSLVPKGGEVHTFDPRPSDARRMSEADLLIMNGLGLDEWLAKLASDTGATGPIVVLGEDLDGVEYIAGDAHEHGEASGTSDGHEGEAVNPHLWLDVSLAARYVDRIADALAEADPDGAAVYRAGASAYQATLDELDTWVRTQLESVPQDHRRVVSFHDAFPYYARAYGLEVVGTIIDAPGQDPSAGEIADLVRAIKEADVPAILAEAQFSPQLAETIAAETGATVVADLYTGSLGDAPVDTYEGMMRWDTERIVEALR
jgi:ABC-type Zn uptake system ZnuABC Zn-binding protein ZnuA